jgi:hypothetical protein
MAALNPPLRHSRLLLDLGPRDRKASTVLECGKVEDKMTSVLSHSRQRGCWKAVFRISPGTAATRCQSMLSYFRLFVMAGIRWAGH